MKVEGGKIRGEEGGRRWNKVRKGQKKVKGGKIRGEEDGRR